MTSVFDGLESGVVSNVRRRCNSLLHLWGSGNFGLRAIMNGLVTPSGRT